MSGPSVKGWCPGAHRPMMSGDGLIVRIRPRLGRLEAAQALGLCALASRFGSGILDLTNRANVQLRGAEPSAHTTLLAELEILGLLDLDPKIESRRNIIVTPLHAEGSPSARLATELTHRLAELPDLPGKFGFALDCDGPPVLRDAPADIRVETCEGELLLLADGADRGRIVTQDTAVDGILALARWFAQSRPKGVRRMAPLLRHTNPPDDWHNTPKQSGTAKLPLGPSACGPVYGAPFGSAKATALAALIHDSGAQALRVTPFRSFFLEGGHPKPSSDFSQTPDDPLMQIDACPGAPFCTSASVQTRTFVRDIAPALKGRRLHISGCEKGCARARAADLTLVGAQGRFNLVRNGCSWDEPQKHSLDHDAIAKEIGHDDAL